MAGASRSESSGTQVSKDGSVEQRLSASQPLEIEQKFRVESHQPLREKLIATGWVLQPSELHCDTYLRHPSRDFRVTGEAFRMRQVNNDFVVTYKGPKQSSEIKTRTEIELPLVENTHDQWFQIWSHLGFTIASQVRKSRESWQQSRDGLGMTVALDDVQQLGLFVEVECVVLDSMQINLAHKTIDAIAKELGLAEVEPRSYLGQILEKSGR